VEGEVVAGEVVDEDERDYLDDLRRLQADFENYKKRMMRQAAETGTRAKASVIERLLPVLDNFERAISHGEGGEGVALVYKEFLGAVQSEGLEEIPAEGVPFDPRVHEAVDAVFEEGLDEEIARTVYQRGYKLGDQVLRPARVVVARPAEEG
jgi:molecular chaperone GrpE